MYIKEIELNNFRNIHNTKVTLRKGLTLFTGNNGQGKTNFIESLFIATKGRSFRKCSRDEIIRYGQSNASVSLLLSNGNQEELRVIFTKEGKTTFLNSKITRSLHRDINVKSLFFNSDTLFYFKNFPRYRLKMVDGFCYHLFGVHFLDPYNRMRRAFVQMRKTSPENPSCETWRKVALSYLSRVNEFRKLLFQTVRDEYESIRESAGLKEIIISFNSGSHQEMRFLRKDKKDLSLGELKTVIFCLYLSVIKKIGSGNIIFLVDDFNAEWDNTMFDRAMELLETQAFQSIAMCLDAGRGKADYTVDKGAIRTYG